MDSLANNLSLPFSLHLKLAVNIETRNFETSSLVANHSEHREVGQFFELPCVIAVMVR
jgi:hypothetical protein